MIDFVTKPLILKLKGGNEMKKAIIIMPILMILFTFAPVLTAAQEIGEFCWGYTYGTKTSIWRFQVTQHGNYYAFNGKELTPTEEIIMSGSGYINGTQVKIGLTSLGVEDPYDLWWAYGVFIINLSDLSGTFYFTEEDPEHCLPGVPPCAKTVSMTLVECP